MEEAVVRRCQAGDIDAFHQIYDQYGDKMLHTALRMLGHRQDAEDAVQTAFMKLHRSIRSFRFRSRFSTYLFRILLNVCFDSLKKRKRRPRESFENRPHPSVNDDPLLRLELQQAIDELAPRMKACFVLFAVEDMKQEEIAETLGLSVGGVKSNIFHAKKRLQSRLTVNSSGVNP